LAHTEDHAPVVVAQAADICFNETSTAPESAQLYRDLILILERNITRIEEDGGVASHGPAYFKTVGLLGFCNEVLGNAGSSCMAQVREPLLTWNGQCNSVLR
jgi:hypothetical protein